MKNALLNTARKLLSPKKQLGALVFMGLTVLLPMASAQATYQYTGNPFTLFSCGPSSPGPGTLDCSTPAPTNPNTSYLATNHVTATLTFDSPLPANMTYGSVTGFSGFQLTMNDGQQTLNAASFPSGTVAEVSTDANGQINSWRVFINSGGALDGGIATINITGSAEDLGTLACCDPNPPGNLALNLSMPGTWSNGSPSPSAAVTNLINVVSNPLLSLTNGQVNSLTDKLNNVLASVQSGANKQAVNQLNAFISSVQSSQKTGKLNTQTATTLTTSAQAIIAML